MAQESIELSKDGIKFSYRRYLSDSTPGFILILLLLAAYYHHGGSAAERVSPTFLNHRPLPDGVKVFVLLLLFLLATPVGVIINVIGWLALEVPQKWLEEKIVKGDFCLMKPFKEEYDLEGATKRLHIGKNQWHEKVRKLETALGKDFPDKSDRIEAIRGIAILLRNLAFMSALAGGIAYVLQPMWIKQPVVTAIVLISLALFLFVLSAFVSFYFHVQLVHWADVLSNDEDAKMIKKVV